MTVSFTLHDQIPSGKNQQREKYVEEVKVRAGRIYKSTRKKFGCNERFALWKGSAGKEILLQKRQLPMVQRMALPLLSNLRLHVFYQALDHTVRDLPGMLDALCHLLEWMEILKNDKQVVELRWHQGCADGCVTMVLEEV